MVRVHASPRRSPDERLKCGRQVGCICSFIAEIARHLQAAQPYQFWETRRKIAMDIRRDASRSGECRGISTEDIVSMRGRSLGRAGLLRRGHGVRCAG